MSDYYDRQGNQIADVLAWSLKRAKDPEYKCVAQTTLPDGKWVSTVWLGLNHNYGDGPPLIFETMVFPKEGRWGELDCERYTTEAEALAGHQMMIDRWVCREDE